MNGILPHAGGMLGTGPQTILPVKDLYIFHPNVSNTAANGSGVFT
jgi:hypothetical protein